MQASATHAELWFLCSPLPDTPINAGYKYSLAVVKVGGTAVSAHLAFKSASLAELFNQGLRGREVVSAAELDAKYYHAFGERPVLLFESVDEMRRFFKSAENYPYEDHLHHYSLTAGLSKY